ncbi:MAG: hypothetical protein MSA31_01410, partial [Bacteroidales bacterium]|nr:hypothetical protein [Bacteroidales bacterium]
GLITAVAAGTATITVTDPGTDAVKGKTLTVTVVVTKEMSGTEICHFTGKTPSLDNVKVTGNYSDSKGTVSYNGKDYDTCVKIESSTSITITPVADCKVTLMFDETSASKGLKIDGEKKTTDAKSTYSFNGTAGTTYTLTKGDVMNLFLIIFEKEGTGISTVETQQAGDTRRYNTAGQRIASPRRGQVYIQNGKKYVK